MRRSFIDSIMSPGSIIGGFMTDFCETPGNAKTALPLLLRVTSAPFAFASRSSSETKSCGYQWAWVSTTGIRPHGDRSLRGRLWLSR